MKNIENKIANRINLKLSFITPRLFLSTVRAQSYQQFLIEIYKSILQRKPDPTGMHSQLQEMMAGRSPNEIIHALLFSEEARQLSGSPHESRTSPLDPQDFKLRNKIKNKIKSKLRSLKKRIRSS